MKHITREEMIDLLRNLKQRRISAKLGMYDEYDDELWGKADAVIEALSETKPAMTIEIERDPKYGGPSLEVLRFYDLGDGKHHLFAVPCSPAKAKDAEGWSVVPDTPTPSMTLQGALAGVSHGNGKFSQKGAESVYKAMLDASRDPDPDECTPAMEAAAEKYWNERKPKKMSNCPSTWRTWKGVYEAMRKAHHQEETER